jgi:hypothetical protein
VSRITDIDVHASPERVSFATNDVSERAVLAGVFRYLAKAAIQLLAVRWESDL